MGVVAMNQSPVEKNGWLEHRGDQRSGLLPLAPASLAAVGGVGAILGELDHPGARNLGNQLFSPAALQLEHLRLASSSHRRRSPVVTASFTFGLAASHQRHRPQADAVLHERVAVRVLDPRTATSDDHRGHPLGELVEDLEPRVSATWDQVVQPVLGPVGL